MKFTEFYKEGSTLLFIKRDIWENGFNLFFFMICFFLSAELCVLVWKNNNIVRITMNILDIIIVFIILIGFLTEKNRPQNSKYFLYIINGELYYERITPEREGYNKHNELINFEIVKFIYEKGTEIKIISNNSLPWGNRKVYLSKEYMPYKNEVVDFLNRNYTIGIDYSDVLAIK